MLLASCCRLNQDHPSNVLVIGCHDARVSWRGQALKEAPLLFAGGAETHRRACLHQVSQSKVMLLMHSMILEAVPHHSLVLVVTSHQPRDIALFLYI